MSRARTRVKNIAHLNVRPAYNGVWDSHSYFLVNRELTIDEEHPWHTYLALLHGRQRGYFTHVEMGGDFTSVKHTVRLEADSLDLKYFPYRGDYLYRVRGDLIPWWFPSSSTISSDVKELLPEDGAAGAQVTDPLIHQSSWPSIIETDEELATLGASLVGSLAPTAPHNNVYTSLGELRNDGLPSIPFLSFLKGGKVPEKVGGEYLNYQFGIAPTISDVKSIMKTVRQADKLWKQYLRDSGRLVRRRMDMKPERTVTTEVLPQESHMVPKGTKVQHWQGLGPVTVTTETETKRWFSAAYMYYVDRTSLQGMEGFLEKSQYLYGWKPSPSGMYNLTPWSWLLDWFTNTGDVIDNISLYLEDPFLTKWAYIMEHQTVTKTYTQTLINNEGKPHNVIAVFTIDSKKRRRVNPFHLGFKGEALTGHQLAILAALGLTRFRNPGSM